MTSVRLGIAGWVAVILVNVFLWAPLIVIGILAFSDANSMTFPPPRFSTRWFEVLATDPDWTDAILTSVQLGIACTGLSLLLGVPLGLGLSRGAIGSSKLAQGLVAAPMVMPAICLAIGFYFVSAKFGLLGTLFPLVVAHATVSVPYVVVTVYAADRSIDKALEPAARTLGASFLRAIWSITLPLIGVGVAGGAVLAFLHSWDDIVNALMLGTAVIRPFPMKLWNEMQHVLYPIADSAAVLLSVVSIVVLGSVGLMLYVIKNRMPENFAASIIFRKNAP